MRRLLATSIKLHEGFRDRPYKDSRGVLTVGYGFNLERGDAKDVLEKAGAEMESVRSGVQTLTEAQCMAILELCVEEALQNVKALVQDWDALPEMCQLVLAEMCYQLGAAKLAKFTRTLDAVNRKDYVFAAKEMLNSIWAIQCPGRAKELASAMKKCGG